ncbi:MAG TPA: hypothetical protein PKN24_12930, partial [bacterium]|nr:hypothetical protein [bacterium]
PATSGLTGQCANQLHHDPSSYCKEEHSYTTKGTKIYLKILLIMSLNYFFLRFLRGQISGQLSL